MSDFTKKRPRQMSEAFITTIFLTLSGGFQDAYTYITRGKVFANAQTGNIVLMSTSLFDGHPIHALRYLAPLAAFILGVYVSEHIRQHYNRRHFHWRQLVLVIEILLLFLVGFLPLSLDTLANVLVSFVCAMQVQAFRKVDGNSYASTMCIGNLRSGTQHLYTWIHHQQSESIQKAMEYFGVILLFAVGAGAGSILSMKFGIRAIWSSCLLLFISLCIMFIRIDMPEIDEHSDT